MAHKVIYQQIDRNIKGDGTVAMLENQCVTIVQRLFGETKVIVLTIKDLKAIMRSIKTTIKK